jgi:hypothetical protein
MREEVNQRPDTDRRGFSHPVYAAAACLVGNHRTSLQTKQNIWWGRCPSAVISSHS